jgi:hypothetical protein
MWQSQIGQRFTYLKNGSTRWLNTQIESQRRGQGIGGIISLGYSVRMQSPVISVSQTVLMLRFILMVATVVFGSLPLFGGAQILQATTISGTMVVGLAPIFLLYFVRSAGPWAFHLAFWPGVGLGIAFTAGWLPNWLALGAGDNAALLAVNLLATGLVFGLFGLGTFIDHLG